MPKNSKLTINLALQGGGAHGAFTWGVLDRLFEEDFNVEGVTGSSAGSMNAAAVTCGLIKGGNQGARETLDNFWKTLADFSAEQNPYKQWSEAFGVEGMDWSPLAIFSDMMSQVFSPYQLNPMNKRPLEEIINKTIDFDVIKNNSSVQCYICATNVQTNRVKIFENDELCAEALLASACIPMLHQAVNVKGHYYWDGGFIGNPILEPLIYNCESDDLFILPLNPLNRPMIPKTSRDILDRLNEINFNGSLVRELRSINIIRQLSSSGQMPHDNEFVQLRLHMIENEAYLVNLPLSSKYDTDWKFFQDLKQNGRDTADEWIKQNWDKVGKEETFKLAKLNIVSDDTRVRIDY